MPWRPADRSSLPALAIVAALEFPNLVGDGATADVRDVLAYARIWF